MKLAPLFLATIALVTACSGADNDPVEEPDEDISGPALDTNVEQPLPPEADEDPFAQDPALEAEAEAEIDSGIPGDSPEADGMADIDLPEELAPLAATKCKKHVTVIATVGVPGLSKYRTNGCWKVIITDGAAVPKDYRKCSTSD